MSKAKEQAYRDTVEIVKAAAGAHQGSVKADTEKGITAAYIQAIYEKLCEIAEDAGM